MERDGKGWKGMEMDGTTVSSVVVTYYRQSGIRTVMLIWYII